MNLEQLSSDIFQEGTLTIFMAAFALVAYFALYKHPGILSALRSRYGEVEGQEYAIYLQKFWGVLFFGLLPAFVLSLTQNKGLADYGWAWRLDALTMKWLLLLSPLMVLMTWISTRKEDSLAQYPEIRREDWDGALLFRSALGWVLYLLAYEWMFRGWLLFAAFRQMGLWPAIAVNTAIYALAHVPKGPREAIGAIPLGVALCLVSLQTGSFFVAFFVHVVLALSNEWFSLYFHSHFTGKRSLKA